jgi:hypothetical protein
MTEVQKKSPKQNDFFFGKKKLNPALRKKKLLLIGKVQRTMNILFLQNTKKTGPV